MEPSSQQQPIQRPPEDLVAGMPEGYPPKREAGEPIAPLDSGLQNHLDELMRKHAKRVEMPIRRPGWDRSDDASEAEEDS